MKVDNLDGYKNYGQYNAASVRQNQGKKENDSTLKTEETMEASVELVKNEESNKNHQATYQVDMKEVARMKAESERYMLDTLKAMAKGQFKDQVKAAKEGNQDSVSYTLEVTIKLTAKQGELGGETELDEVEGTNPTMNNQLDAYWSAEQTSDRMLKFAKSLSGNNPEKAELLKNAFIEGYKQAKEAFGGKLPQVSEDTYKMTLEKFDAWQKGEEN